MARDDSRNEGDERTELSGSVTSRRRFLEATGVAGLVGGIDGFSLAQQELTTTYEFGGEIAGWRGQAPAAIEGQTNPTLELEAGTTYEVVWKNLDGAPHNFTIQDADGNNVASTETMSNQGETLSLTFTASEEMAQYICTIHPSSMVGAIEIVGGGGGTPTEGTPTPTPQERVFVPEGPTVGAQLIADGPLVNPVTLRTVPGMENTHLIVDQVGAVYVLQDGELRDEPFMDVRGRVMVLADTQGGFERPEGFDERGLLGLDFHPNFEENGQFYIRYSTPNPVGDLPFIGPGERGYPEDWDHIAVLAEFQVDEDAEQFQADPESQRALLEVPEPQFNHNGGEVTFGPDGYLYTSLGDGGDGNDTGVGHVEDWYEDNDGGNGQDVTRNLLGSILRINVDEEGENMRYAVPEDNPLVGTDGRDEIYAWGLRNPWRMSFNDGQLIAADVGQVLFEAVSVIENGGNYGWNVREGSHCFNADNATQPLEQCPSSAPDQAPYNGQELQDPVLEYPHTYQGASVGISITGGYVYQADELSELSGRYVFGDWSQSFTRPRGRIFVATTDGQDGGTPTETETATPGEETPTGTEEETRSPTPLKERVDIREPSNQPWPYEEVMIQGGEGNRLNRFIQAFGRDANGNVYVLASRTGRLTSEAGEVYRLVPAGEGETVTPPPTPTETPGTEAGEAETEPTSMTETPTPGTETDTGTETPTPGEEGTETPTETPEEGTETPTETP